MKKLIALCLILGLIVAPCFATLTPTVKGKIITSRGVMVWGTFTGLPANTAGSTTFVVPGINTITSLSTWAASVVSTQGACAITALSGHTITVSQEAVFANFSGGYFMVIGR